MTIIDTPDFVFVAMGATIAVLTLLYRYRGKS